MQTDKKIEEYLDRAIAISNKGEGKYGRFRADEIAKMIQLEEHQREFIELNK